MSRNIYDIDPAGNVLCTYNGESQESLRAHQTKIPPLTALLHAFLPAGYPHSVTTDYLPYQTYDSLQAFFSSISSLLANRAVLEGLGVGDASSSPTGALILKIASDTISRVATILFAHRLGTAVEPECKFFRFLADCLNDAAQLLDLLVPAMMERWYGLKLGVIVGAGVLRSWCGVAASASKASLSAHFIVVVASQQKGGGNNLAELNAKEASQETVVSLLGMLVGSLVVKVVQDRLVVWGLMVGLLGVHLLMNYWGVRSVRCRTLNRQRATMVVREWLETGRVLGPEEVSKRESILQLRIGWGRGGGWTGFGRMASKSGEYTGTCEFGTYGDVKALAGWKGGYHSYEIEADGYFMGICHRGGSFRMRIALKEEEGGKKTSSSARANSPLEAWFDAVSHAYHFDSALKDGLESHYENEVPLLGYTSEEQKGTVFAALAAAGWDLETNALETRSPVRVRVGDGKKVPISSEKDLIRQPHVSKKD
ncbi:vitamin B6 photo-protection and homoeostasis-domain-containing protein [Neurospora hispaniola]|uniref:Vitamin B6 photo-protection and homoeostasis-domain-containing protein n=1 Tax=Neurospora hispaniola TaxID=588809 RepID=A0AAJ0I0N6_9PEZI|nr:vitamin B6 photo-protection and homoeostasis-domain-containing protein [Neurospora hispaniola]